MKTNPKAKTQLIVASIETIAILIPYSQAFALTYPSLTAFYPSGCGTNTSATMDVVINSAFSVTNSEASDPSLNGDGNFEIDLVATVYPSYVGVNPDFLEL